MLFNIAGAPMTECESASPDIAAADFPINSLRERGVLDGFGFFIRLIFLWLQF
jgi:hypothetical protein